MEMLPLQYQKQADWLMNHHHFIQWGEGFTALYYLSTIIKRVTRDVDMIYVKGLEKLEFIKTYCTHTDYGNRHKHKH